MQPQRNKAASGRFGASSAEQRRAPAAGRLAAPVAPRRKPLAGLQNIRSSLERLLIPTPMVRAGMFFLADDAGEVVSVLARLGACQIARAPTELKDYLSPYFPDDFNAAFRRLRDLYQPLAARWHLTGKASLSGAAAHVPTVEAMRGTANALDKLSAQVDDLVQRGKQLDHRQVELEHFDEYMRVLSELDIDVSALADLRFLHLRVGTVPLENLHRLQESAALSEDLVLSLGTRRDRAHVMVVGAGGITPDLEGLLGKAHFESIDPTHSILVGGPADVHARLQDESFSNQGQRRELEIEEGRLRHQHQHMLLEAGRLVAHAAVFAQCEGALEGRDPVACLTGWVPRHRLPELQHLLAREVPRPVALVQEPPWDGGDGTPPSEMPVPAIFGPGVSLATLYGPPGYDEINPALLLAVATPLMFGMMFGDVGYGLLLALAVIAGRRWLGHWVAAGLSCSLASIFFGCLYGSVFGVEHWLPALWLRPMEEPFRLLGFALWAGVGFILVTFLLKALSLLRQGDRMKALLSFQGGAGALFYLGGVFVFRSLYLGQAVSLFAAGLVFTGIALTLIHLAQELRAEGRKALADLASEYSHGTLALLTNTLSFLRLAAFALSHAALSAALLLVVETIPPTPLGWACRVLVMIVGSTAALVLHVLVVAVQTIRLEFYEGLTRFYRGDGHLYQPLRFSDTAS